MNLIPRRRTKTRRGWSGLTVEEGRAPAVHHKVVRDLGLGAELNDPLNVAQIARQADLGAGAEGSVQLAGGGF